MALQTSMPFVGSGEFVQEREWSCAKHSYPMEHECDCRHCRRRWDCRSCAHAKWVELTDEEGSPKMRELSVMEVGLRNSLVSGDLARTNHLLAALRGWQEDTPIPAVVWLEDEVDATTGDCGAVATQDSP